jgi:hypothetical protein
MNYREIRDSRIGWISLLLIGTGLFSGCLGFGNSGISHFQLSPSRSFNWEIALTRLKVADAQEDRSLMGVPISDGDEPYLIMIGFKSRFGKSGSTDILTITFENDDWAVHV